MGEARRRKLSDPNWQIASKVRPSSPKAGYRAWTYMNDYEIIKRLTLDEALNAANFFTEDQAKKRVLEGMFLPDICKMQINNKVYARVKEVCLKKTWLDVGNRGLILWGDDAE